MLQASELSYGYSSRRGDAQSFTLDHVSVTVDRGSLTGLLGPNGCGKTTLLKLLSGVLQPEHGHVSLNGSSLAGRLQMLDGRSMEWTEMRVHRDPQCSVCAGLRA